MRARALLLLLVISIGLQGFALAGQILGSDRSGGTAHSVLHADGVAHHHDADGTVHKDASQKSQQHVQDDGCTACPVIPSAASSFAVAPALAARNATVGWGQDTPYLEGLERPPR